MKIGPLLAHVAELEENLAVELRAAADRNRGEHDIYHQCHTFAITADKRVRKLGPSRSGTAGSPCGKRRSEMEARTCSKTCG